MTLETSIGPSFSMIPDDWAFCVSLTERGRVWRLTMFRPSTKTLRRAGSVRITRPVLPLSLPAVTTTESSLRMCIALAIRNTSIALRPSANESAPRS